MKHQDISAFYKDLDAYAGKTVTVCGWARSIRDSKTLGFIDMNDGTCFKGVQVVFEDGKIDNFKEIAAQNVGAALIVSLGCEGTDTERLYDAIRASGKPAAIIRIQELGGVSAAIKAGIDAAQELVMEISGLAREPVDISRVVMSIKCGASDATSGMASNCVIG